MYYNYRNDSNFSNTLKATSLSIIGSTEHESNNNNNNRTIEALRNGVSTNGHDDWLNTASLTTVILIPTVVILGLFGNIVTAQIYWDRKMRRSSVNVLLGGLAASDAIMLFFGGTVMFPLGLYAYFCEYEWYMTYLGYATVYGYPLAVTAQITSIYILILTTFERYLSVSDPLAARRWFTVRSAWLGIFMSALGSFAFCFIRFFEYRIVPVAPNSTIIRLNETTLKQHPTYAFVYGMILDLTVTFGIPLILLFVLNAKIVRAVSIASRFYDQSLLIDREEAKAKKFQTTWMMIVVILIFLSSNSFAFFITIVEATSKHSFEAAFVYFLIDLSNLLIQLNAAVNFVIYLSINATYRTLFLYKFHCLNKLPSNMQFTMVQQSMPTTFEMMRAAQPFGRNSTQI